MFLKRIENWLIHSQKYFFTFSDGFFNLSYMMNSPRVMFDCMAKMPFIKYYSKTDKIIAKNPFCEGTIYYHDIEDGLCLLVTDVKFKANLKIKLIFDKFIPIEHYNLVLHLDQIKFPINKIIDTDLNYQKNFWSFIKPGSIEADYHFKDSHGKYISVHFTEAWLNKCIENKKTIHRLYEFINSEFRYNVWFDDNKKLDNLYDTFLYLIERKEKGLVVNQEIIKNRVYDFLDIFFNSVLLKKENNITSSGNLLYLLMAEKYILEDMTNFIGVEKLAKKIFISTTKLKTDFKKYFGKSIYQFYSENQMILANTFLEKKEFQIKEVAQMFGYENSGKFSLAYKKYFGKLPSEKHPFSKK
jgi:AraC-like DNA-binding protein